MRTTYTYARLEIPAEAWDAIFKEIKEAGKEYIDRYVKDDDDMGGMLIHFEGSEVALKRSNKESLIDLLDKLEASDLKGLPPEYYHGFDEAIDKVKNLLEQF